MAKELVIVESPAKARTVGRILGRGYTVKASVGHVRDLPKSRLGVDIEQDFAPHYVIPKEKKEIVKELKEAVQKASAVYLATDPDREGEAISWHLVEATGLDDKVPVRRVVFHEITREAVEEAFHHPRAIDMQLVDAQQARRVLDRLVGYKISPILWRKVKRGLSAGRVQSVALRMVVDREKEIQGFVPVEYWSIEAELAKNKSEKKAKSQGFRAKLIGYLGSKEKLEIHTAAEADGITASLRQANYSVADVRKKKEERHPAPPFTTSTLQQEASRKLRFTAKRTMALAQQLYEGLPIGSEGEVGLITYMRTDSTRVATSARDETRAFIARKFGKQFVPASARVYTAKAKGAQEAHEAIRPTSVLREPASLKPHLTSEQLRLYDLIWKRMVASQMASAAFEVTTADVDAKPGAGKHYLFRSASSVVTFPGFLTLYSEGKDEEEEAAQKPLPDLAKGEPLDLLALFPEQHFTQPPPRYTEATLIRALEENGIGRPSTYAPTLSTIQDRGYVHKVQGRFQPLEMGTLVNDLLTEHFASFVDIKFTARMEEELDEIARGERKWAPVLKEFYAPLSTLVEKASLEIPRIKVQDEPTGELCEQCGRPLVIKTGRFGKFIACSGFPECRYTRRFTNKVGVACPECGGDLVERRGKGRTFYGCANYPKCKFTMRARPLPQPCPSCGGILVASDDAAKCIKCGKKAVLAQHPEPVGAGKP
ncbi:MAG: type I DNA topoisomerase [Chloroflexi bacterium]|nr:type I DNA topoisomerase [Chloroflexota bacterium]